MFVISFYSDPLGSEVYATYAKSLAEDLTKIQVDFQIDRLPHQGNWIDTCHMKPEFIESALDRLQRPLVWVDVDSRVLAPLPEIALESYDIAAPQSKNHNTGMVTISVEVALLFINNTERARVFLKQWRRRCEISPLPVTDHYHFLHTWTELNQPGTKLQVLPNSYCRDIEGPDTIVQLRRSQCQLRNAEMAAVNRFHRTAGTMRSAPPRYRS